MKFTGFIAVLCNIYNVDELMKNNFVDGDNKLLDQLLREEFLSK